MIQLPFFCFLRFYDSNVISQLFPYSGIDCIKVIDSERIAEKEVKE